MEAQRGWKGTDMGRIPTLQSLALTALECFGEDASSFEESIPSSLDAVVMGYAEASHREDAVAHVGSALRRHLQTRGWTASQTSVDEFAQMALSYLRAVYPDAAAVQDADERRALSHLFWGNLVEARSAVGVPRVGASRAPSRHVEMAVEHTISCSCGAALTSGDEEELYRFARTHAERRHPAPQPPVPQYTMEVRPSSRTKTAEAIVQRWEEEVVNRGDLAAIDDLSPAGSAAELKAEVTRLRTAFPDLHVTIEEIVADADEVALRSRLRGTHCGAFRGVAPTGKQVTVEAYEFFRIRDNKIVEHRGSVEEARLLQQLGVLPEHARV